ncbi:hypothetical protein [Streptomyces sp. F8]|uniref:hypothetical protein n=1 Tax=Streptomyces sp. F8 TaxID=1436085 RepID=UPI0029D40E35|nr:hypothetical protein [Streptomyces sp. F8]
MLTVVLVLVLVRVIVFAFVFVFVISGFSALVVAVFRVTARLTGCLSPLDQVKANVC